MKSRLPTNPPRPPWCVRAAEARARAAEWKSIRASAIRFGVAAADADDVAQEVALSMENGHSNIDRAALVGITLQWRAVAHLRTCYQRRRAHAAAGPQLRVLAITPSGEPDLLARAPRVLLLRAVEALRELDPTLHEVVRLQLEGHTLVEIAAAQGTPYGTAVSRTYRARIALRETARRWAAEDTGRMQRSALHGGAAHDRRPRTA